MPCLPGPAFAPFRSALVLCVALLLSSAGWAQTQAKAASVPLSNPRLRLVGQVDDLDAAHPRLAYPGTGLLLRFTGRSIGLDVDSSSDTSALTVLVNEGAPLTYVLHQGPQNLVIAADTTDGPQTVQIVKRTETWQGVLTLEDITVPEGTTLLAAPELPTRKLLFIGDSVTCGTGLDDNATCVNDRQHPSSNAYQTYGMLLGRRLDAESRLVCYGGRGLERDYRGLEAKDHVLTVPELIELSVPADEPGQRATWETKRWQPAALVVSVGTNDFNLQKTKPLNQGRWVGEYVQFVRQLRQDYPDALIFLTEGSIVTDPLLRTYVQETVKRMGDARVRYLPSVHYPGHSCDGHPTEEQHFHIANDFEPALREALGW